MFHRVTLGVVVCFAATSAALGQEFPQPGPEHKTLHELEGEWDAVMDMAGQKAKAKATYRKICGGMWMESDFESEFGGLAFQGHGLDGYDLNKKKYVAVWVDSMSSAPMFMEGNYDERKVLVMTGESAGPDGAPQKFKTTTESKDKDHFTFKMFMVEPGGKEQLAFTIEYSRKK